MTVTRADLEKVWAEPDTSRVKQLCMLAVRVEQEREEERSVKVLHHMQAKQKELDALRFELDSRADNDHRATARERDLRAQASEQRALVRGLRDREQVLRAKVADQQDQLEVLIAEVARRHDDRLTKSLCTLHC